MTFESKSIQLLHRHALYNLVVFDHFCNKHNLTYSLAFGTLIGSIREQSIIVWDDDIDVVMLRPEYERFLKLAQSQLNDYVLVQNFNTDPQFIHSFTRLVLKGTKAVQDSWRELDFNKGIFIDVFPLDKMAPKESIKDHEKAINKYRRRKLNKLVNDNETQTTPFMNSVRRLLQLPYSMQTLNKQMDTLCQKYNASQSDTTSVCAMSEGVMGYYESYQMDPRAFDNLIKGKLEEFEFPIFKDYHSILTSMYDDYMSVPISKKRQPHHGFKYFKFRDDIEILLEQEMIKIKTND